MSIKKIINTENKIQSDNQIKNGSVSGKESFKEILEQFVTCTKKKSESQKKLPDSVNIISINDTYNSFNALKINHLNGNVKNSSLVENAMSVVDGDRTEKLKLVRERIKEGFYLRDDVINDTAGKILDSLGS